MDYFTKINTIIDNLDLPDELEDNKEILKARFVAEVSYYEKKRDNTKKYYDVFRFIVTTGSILLPALLSIGQMDPTKLPRHFEFEGSVLLQKVLFTFYKRPPFKTKCKFAHGHINVLTSKA